MRFLAIVSVFFVGTQVAFSAPVLRAFDSNVITRDLQPAQLQKRAPSSPTSPKLNTEERPKLTIATRPKDGDKTTFSEGEDSPQFTFHFNIPKAEEAHSAPIPNAGGSTFLVSPQERKSRSAPVTNLPLSPIPEKSSLTQDPPKPPKLKPLKGELSAVPESSTLGGSFKVKGASEQDSLAVPESSTLGGSFKVMGASKQDSLAVPESSTLGGSFSRLVEKWTYGLTRVLKTYW
ncbi:hypothetical protein K439DRAFT_1619348 [Ramaria rubella]|nr:hypothetical protein K439DRAFT_1619348 [Ramaria rubella]